MTASLYDSTLIYASGDLAHIPATDLHTYIVNRISDGAAGCLGVLYAALYVPSQESPDTLSQLVADVDDTQGYLAMALGGAQVFTHDAPCRRNGDDKCIDCMAIAELNADEALRYLREFLGETAAADQRIAA